MKMKKLFIISLSAVFLLSSVSPAYAATSGAKCNQNEQGDKNKNRENDQGEDEDNDRDQNKGKDKEKVQNESKVINYNTFTGKVKEITDKANGLKHVYVENKDGAAAYIVISSATQILDNKKITVGSYITAFYDANAPMIMIYPPQYNADIVIVNPEEGTNYQAFTGTVKEITESKVVKGQKTAYVESKDGLAANIVISNDTYVVKDATIKVGTVVTTYYDANAPMIMIYPPQYSAKVVIAINKSKEDTKKDKEDKKKDKKDKKKETKDAKKALKDKSKAMRKSIKNAKFATSYGQMKKAANSQGK